MFNIFTLFILTNAKKKKTIIIIILILVCNTPDKLKIILNAYFGQNFILLYPNIISIIRWKVGKLSISSQKFTLPRRSCQGHSAVFDNRGITILGKNLGLCIHSTSYSHWQDETQKIIPFKEHKLTGKQTAWTKFLRIMQSVCIVGTC